MEDGSFAVSVENLLRSATQLSSGEEGGVMQFKSLLTLTVPEEKPFSITSGWSPAENKIADKRKH